MTWPRSNFALIQKNALLLCISVMCFPTPAFSQETAPFLLLRPHCEEGEELCPDFAIRDPQTRETDTLSMGDILDIDLVIKNPAGTSFQRVRAWIAYNPEVLEGIRIDLSPEFSLPTPGENNFFSEEGYIKIGASADQELRKNTVIVARMQFRVKGTSAKNTLLTFFDSQHGAQSHTGIFSGMAETENTILDTDPGHLFVHVTGEDPSITQPMEKQEDVIMEKTSVPKEPLESVFSSLQVQNLRVTTEGSAVFLAWDPLPAAELIGYNLYYGTVSGQYTQKRSNDTASTSTTIRGLPTGELYYFAIRGAKNTVEETAYSQEVAVQVGSPASATSPLTGQLPQGETAQVVRKTPGISGDTGLPSGVLLLITASAITGMAFAFRRQCHASIIS
ncbi:hypothetical protein A3D11_04165 [Candidatus Peribacteria bacterium RIFCSPHIGHO2_02_FULL_49_16]|nr:MAG: hypothetical protein A2880_00255 [Candidatus Peribacteria bacterium RIFCSPHIGHO2_01_FULL_49_38]OGJ59193.1 MAG: hypothetical protein A3D11_04165 [Candidatus Peribacteria bacterium RIFCSPHIGHO2_02_FULL_49_16]